ncbi:MAG TPA: hypothetical protein VGN44_09545 [Candidatus Angelobacter sp.]|jgi:hypothetical protein
MTKQILAFIFLLVLVLTALCYWHPNAFLFYALYPGIIAGLAVSNVHGEAAQFKLGFAAEILVNFLVYSAVASLLLRPRKSSN